MVKKRVWKWLLYQKEEKIEREAKCAGEQPTKPKKIGRDAYECQNRKYAWKWRVKRASEPKRKNDRKGSFPKCAGEQPKNQNKLAGMPTNVKIENIPENEGKECENDFCTEKKKWYDMKEKSVKMTSVPKSTNDRKGSFPKCARENYIKMKEKSVKLTSVPKRKNYNKGSFPKYTGRKECENDFCTKKKK